MHAYISMQGEGGNRGRGGGDVLSQRAPFISGGGGHVVILSDGAGHVSVKGCSARPCFGHHFSCLTPRCFKSDSISIPINTDIFNPHVGESSVSLFMTRVIINLQILNIY